MSKLRWADADDGDDLLPESTTVGPNEKGILIKTEYYKNDKGEAMKKTTKLQLVKVQTKTYAVTEERKQWARFGKAKNNQGVTMQSVDEIMFERNNKPKKAEKKDAKMDPTAGKSLTEILAERRRHRELLRAQGLLEPINEAPQEDEGGRGAPAPASNREGKYVPPSQKHGAAAGGYGNRDSDPSLRVSNLSENVTDTDLKMLFGAFGEISRVYVARDRETQEHRGFAFVNFRHKFDAENAMKNLDGYGYDNMILRVEMAAPREQR